MQIKEIRCRLAVALLICTLAALNAPADDDADALPGRLCLVTAESAAETDCVDTEEAEIVIEPVPESRQWTWVSADGARVHFGTASASATSIAIDPASPGARMRVSWQSQDRRPESYSVRLSQEESSWAVDVPAISKLVTLSAPAGDGDLTLTAPRHLSEVRHQVLFSDENLELGTIVLRPVPSLQIEVVDSSGTAVVGSWISSLDSETLAISDGTGRIEWEPEELLPSAIVVSASGYAPLIREIQIRDRDYGPERVILSRGATITVELNRALDQEVDVEVVRDDGGNESKTLVLADGVLAEGEQTVTLESVPAGAHKLLLRGREPLERYMLPLAVEEGVAQTVPVDIHPFELRAEVTIDGEPAAHADMRILKGWREAVTTDADGKYSGPMWQKGDMAAMITLEELDFSAFESFELEGEDEVETVRFDLADYEISGRIYEQTTGATLPQARLLYRFEAENRGGTGRLQVKPDGTFRKRGFAPGRYELLVNLDGYLPLKQELHLSAAEPRHQVELALEQGSMLHVLVVDDSGRPQPNAVVAELVPQTVRAVQTGPETWSTDATGRAAIPMRQGQVRHVWTISPTAGLAASTLRQSDTSASGTPETVVVPRAAGNLEVVALSASNEPLGHHSIAMRLDGVAVPGSVMRILERQRTVSLRFDSAGRLEIPGMPAGQVDLWVLRWGPNSPPEKAPHATTYFAGGSQSVVIHLAPRENDGRMSGVAAR